MSILDSNTFGDGMEEEALSQFINHNHGDSKPPTPLDHQHATKGRRRTKAFIVADQQPNKPPSPMSSISISHLPTENLLISTPESASSMIPSVTHPYKNQTIPPTKNTVAASMTSSSILNAASNLLRNSNESSTCSNNEPTQQTNEPGHAPELPNESPSSRKKSLINLNVCYFNTSPPEEDSYLASLNEDEEDESTVSLSSPIFEEKHDESFSSTSVAIEETKENTDSKIVQDLSQVAVKLNSSYMEPETIVNDKHQKSLEFTENQISTEEQRIIEHQCQGDQTPNKENTHEKGHCLEKELIFEEKGIEKLEPPLTEPSKHSDNEENSFTKHLATIENLNESNKEELCTEDGIEKNKCTNVNENNQHLIIGDSFMSEEETIKRETVQNLPDDVFEAIHGDSSLETKFSNGNSIIEKERFEILSDATDDGLIRNEKTINCGNIGGGTLSELEHVDTQNSDLNICEDASSQQSCESHNTDISKDDKETKEKNHVHSVEVHFDATDSDPITSKGDSVKNFPVGAISEIQQDIEEENFDWFDTIIEDDVSFETEPTTLSQKQPLLEPIISKKEEENVHTFPENIVNAETVIIEATMTEENVVNEIIQQAIENNEPSNNIESFPTTNDEPENIVPQSDPRSQEISTHEELPLVGLEQPKSNTDGDDLTHSEGVLVSPQKIEGTVENLTISLPKKQTQESQPLDTQETQTTQLLVRKFNRKEQISQSNEMNNNNEIKVSDSRYEEQAPDVLDRGTDDEDTKVSVLEEYLISKINDEEGYDDLEKKVFASFEGDFSSYEQAIREEIRLLSESIEKRSKDIQESDPIVSTPKQEQRPLVDLQLSSPESPSNMGEDPFACKRMSPRRLIYSHQKIDTLTIRNSIEEYDNQRLVYERQKNFQTLNTFDIKIRKDILGEVIKIEDRFEHEFDQRKKNIKELLEDQKQEISDLWSKRIFEYDQLTIKIMTDISERHKHELVQQEEKLRVSFGRKKPNFSKNTLAERSLYNLIASSKQYERGVGMEEKITNLERKDIINFYHQQEQHVAKKLEFLASKQLQELSVTQQRIDRGRKEMEMHMDDDIKKVDNRSNILFKDLERKRALVNTQLRTFKDKFRGPNSPVKKQIFLHHSEDFEDPIQESTVNINACLEFFLVIPDRINHFFQSVDKTETEVEKETCNIIRRLADHIEGVQHSPRHSPKSPSVESKMNSMSPNSKSPASLFREAFPSSPIRKDVKPPSSSDSTPKKDLVSPLKDSPKKTPTRPSSLEEVLRNKKKPTPKHNFSSLIQYSGKTHLK